MMERTTAWCGDSRSAAAATAEQQWTDPGVIRVSAAVKVVSKYVSALCALMLWTECPCVLSPKPEVEQP